MSSLLVHTAAVAAAFLFSAAHSQWVQCGTEYGFPTLRNCHAALDAMAAAPNPGAQFLVGPRYGTRVPTIYLPFSIQVADCLIVFNGTAFDFTTWAELVTMADFAVSGTPHVHGCVTSQGTGGKAKFTASDPTYAVIKGASSPIFKIPVDPLTIPDGRGGGQAPCRPKTPGNCDSPCKTKAYENMQQCEKAFGSCSPGPGASGATCILSPVRDKATQRRTLRR